MLGRSSDWISLQRFTSDFPFLSSWAFLNDLLKSWVKSTHRFIKQHTRFVIDTNDIISLSTRKIREKRGPNNKFLVYFELAMSLVITKLDKCIPYLKPYLTCL